MCVTTSINHCRPLKMPRVVVEAGAAEKPQQQQQHSEGGRTERQHTVLPKSSEKLTITELSNDDSVATLSSIGATECSSFSSLDENNSRANKVSGCLKVRSQARSLARTYAGPSPQAKSVSWDTIEIHSHNAILGDNPAVSYGPPLSIGNTLLRTDRLSIDAYENHRRERRPSDDLRVPRVERERKLMKAGYSRSEILQVTLKMDRIRIRRQVSARGGPIQQVRDLVLRRRKQRARAQKIVKE